MSDADKNLEKNLSQKFLFHLEHFFLLLSLSFSTNIQTQLNEDFHKILFWMNEIQKKR